MSVTKFLIVYLLTLAGCLVVIKTSSAQASNAQAGQTAQTKTTLRVVVNELSGKALANAIVEVDISELPVDGLSSVYEVEQTMATMDQAQLAFKPHILAVQAGTKVAFPNSDNVQHHVYSFSEAKTFEIQVYRQNLESSIEFDKPGVAELGCNVHDWMLGYIYVAKTSLFARTNQQGIANIELPSGVALENIVLTAWHPRMHEKDQQQVFSFARPANTGEAIAIKLAYEMYPALAGFDEGGLSDY